MNGLFTRVNLRLTSRRGGDASGLLADVLGMLVTSMAAVTLGVFTKLEVAANSGEASPRITWENIFSNRCGHFSESWQEQIMIATAVMEAPMGVVYRALILVKILVRLLSLLDPWFWS